MHLLQQLLETTESVGRTAVLELQQRLIDDVPDEVTVNAISVDKAFTDWQNQTEAKHRRLMLKRDGFGMIVQVVIGEYDWYLMPGANPDDVIRHNMNRWHTEGYDIVVTFFNAVAQR